MTEDPCATKDLLAASLPNVVEGHAEEEPGKAEGVLVPVQDLLEVGLGLRQEGRLIQHVAEPVEIDR